MKCVRGTIDSRLEIRSSRLKNINLSLLGILMTIISEFMLLAGLCGGSILYNIFTIFIGLFGTFFLERQHCFTLEIFL